MRLTHTFGVLAIAGAALAAPLGALAQSGGLVDGHDWQNSSVQDQRAYLIGVSNVISVGARYDSKKGATDSFALRAQRSLAGAELGPAVETVDAWYAAHPTALDTPVLSVIWTQVAKQAK